MVVTNAGLNRIRDLITTDFTSGGIGLSSTAATVSDSGLFGGGTTIDACDATTGWAQGGDGAAVVLNTTAGSFKEGTGALNIPLTHSTGTSTWSKTISSTDLSGKKIAVWFYISDKTLLSSSATDAVAVVLGTGGYTDTNEYHTAASSLVNGWNSLQVTTSTISASTGAGATLSGVDSIRLRVKSSASVTGTNMRMDYWRSYTAGTFGVTDSKHAVTWTTFDQGMKSTHTVASTESNGLSIYEAGDSSATILLSRFTHAVIDKTESVDMTIDKYYFLKSD